MTAPGKWVPAETCGALVEEAICATLTGRFFKGTVEETLTAARRRVDDLLADLAQVDNRLLTGAHGSEPLGGWWLHVPRLSNAFQLQCFVGDAARRLWWGNQVVGAIERHPTVPERWLSLGRDGFRLMPEPDAESDGLYVDPEAALLHARDAWRGRDATVYDALGLDYWIEPRPRRGRGVESLWLGRTHLGHIQPAPGGTWSAFPTEDAPAAAEGAITDAAEVTRDGTYPTRHAALRAVQHTWHAHLHRILGVRP